MNATTRKIAVLALTGCLAVPLFAEGPRGDREGKGPMGQKRHPLLDMMDTDGDEMVSKVEMMNHFDQVDANGDGLISKDEAKAFHESRRGEREKTREAFKDMTPEERFAAMDKNGNGSIDPDEFHRGKEAFAKIDTDGSGSLSQDELKACKEKMKDKEPRHERKGQKKDNKGEAEAER